MPRLGQNPMKWDNTGVHQPARVTVTTVTFIPFLEGYWQQSLDVLKLCLQSMRENTEVPFDLMILDNGSCPEVIDYLTEQYHAGNIQFLILSQHNLGKVGAWNILFSSAPGEIISFCDSDVFFLKDWLAESITVLTNFPKAGMVTAQPIPGPLATHQANTARAAELDPSITVQKGDSLIPDHYLRVHQSGLGRTDAEYSKMLSGRLDVLLMHNEIKSYVGGSHFQFTSYRHILQNLLPFQPSSGLNPQDDIHLDNGIDQAGYWRLSTVLYLVQHMGNQVPNLQEELAPLGLRALPAIQKPTKPAHKNHRLFNNKYIRSGLRRLNLLTFKLLYR